MGFDGMKAIMAGIIQRLIMQVGQIGQISQIGHAV